MIQTVIFKWIVKFIIKAISRKHDLKKIDDYVNKDNILDKKMESVNKRLNKYGQYIEEIEKDIASVKAIAHKPVDWLNKIKDLESEVKVLKDVASTSNSIKDRFKKLRR